MGSLCESTNQRFTVTCAIGEEVLLMLASKSIYEPTDIEMTCHRDGLAPDGRRSSGEGDFPFPFQVPMINNIWKEGTGT